MKLPLLFEKIIEHDRCDPRHVAKSNNVPIMLNDYRVWKKDKRMLIVSAEAYISKQRNKET